MTSAIKDNCSRGKVRGFLKECNTDYAEGAFDLLRKATLTPEELIDAACCLRTAFDVDFWGLLKKHNSKVTFRDDRTRFTLVELWDSAKETMNNVNVAAAAPLASDIEAHILSFLMTEPIPWLAVWIKPL